MEIYINCKWDYDAVKALTNVGIYKKTSPAKTFIFTTAWLIILAAVLGFEMCKLGADSVFLLLFGLVLLLILMDCFLYFILPKIRYHALGKMQGTENKYVFTDEKIFAFSRSEANSGKSEIDYTYFTKAMETSKYIFLYQNNVQAFILDKSTISGGTVEELRKKLFSFLGEKYIRCKY